MRNLSKFLSIAAVGLVSVFAHAQYTVVPSQCGIQQPTLSCIVDLSPETSAGVYPTMRLYQVDYKTPAQYQGYVEFSTVKDPQGYLGYAQVYSSEPTGSGVQIWFIGTYASTNVTYTGTAILGIGYRQVRISGRLVTYVSVVNGSLTFD